MFTNRNFLFLVVVLLGVQHVQPFSLPAASLRRLQQQQQSLNNVFRFEPISLMEEPPIGTLVVDLAGKLEITDLATSEYKFRFYSPQSLAAHYFMIDQLTGQVKTQRSIDREYLCETKACGPCSDSFTNCTLPIEIVAAVSSSSSSAGPKAPGVNKMFQQKFVSFDVVVEDKNEFAPEFAKSTLLISISENTPANFTVPIEPATDRDSRPTLVTYRLEPADDSASSEAERRRLNARVRLSPTQTSSGQSSSALSQLNLVIVEPFDYETEKEFSFKIVATDQGGRSDGDKPLAGTCLVTLSIVDVNDNLPVFDRAEYEYRLDEDKAVSGARLIRVHATDRDDGLNGAVKYSLIDQTITAATGDKQQQAVNIKSLFEIDETSGWIQVAPGAQLNYELLPTYRLTVRAQDSGPAGSSMPVFTNVIVHLNDVNDNAPQISLNLPESTTSDADRFGFDSVSAGAGDVQIITQLDVSEWTMPETFLAQVILADKDSGPNGRVRVELEQRRRRTRTEADGQPEDWSPSDMFALVHLFNSIYALVSKQPFDRESHDQYALNITACDFGQPTQLCSTYNLLVVIKDENDNAPLFVAEHTLHGSVVRNEHGQVSSITFNVLEANAIELAKRRNSSSSTPDDGDDEEWINVGQVRAHDKDEHENARITYEMTLVNGGVDGGEDAFQIDPASGLVRARLARLDRERVEDYEFRLTARDGCDQCATRNKAVAQLFVHLIDVNDHEPRFEKPVYKYRLSENMRMPAAGNRPYLIDRLRAHDADKANTSNALVKYRLVALESEPVDDLVEYFQVDAATGDLFLLRPLDFEMMPSYQFAVLAYNEANDKAVGVELSSRCLVQIQVLDLNDNAPVLNSPTDRDLPLFFSLEAALAAKHARPTASGEARATTTSRRTPPLRLGLFRVNASDADSAENGKLTFSIERVMKLVKHDYAELDSTSSPDQQYDDYNSPAPGSYESYDDGQTASSSGVELSPQERQLQRLFECDRLSGQVSLRLRASPSKSLRELAERSDSSSSSSQSAPSFVPLNETTGGPELGFDPALDGVYGLVVRISDGHFLSRAFVFLVITKEPFSVQQQELEMNATLTNTTTTTTDEESDDESLVQQVGRLRRFLAENQLNAMTRPFTVSASAAAIPESNLFVDDDHKASYRAYKTFLAFFKPKHSLTLNKQNNRLSGLYDTRFDEEAGDYSSSSSSSSAGLLSRMGLVRLKNQLLAAFSGKNYKYFVIFSVSAIFMVCFILMSLCMSVYLFNKRRRASNKVLSASGGHAGTLGRRATLKHGSDELCMAADDANLIKSTSEELSENCLARHASKSASSKRLKKYQKTKSKGSSLSSAKPLLNGSASGRGKMKNSSTSNCSGSGDEFDGVAKYASSRASAAASRLAAGSGEHCGGSSSETTNIIEVSSVSPTSSKLIQFQTSSSSSHSSSTPHSPASLNLYKYDIEQQQQQQPHKSQTTTTAESQRSSNEANFSIVYKKCLRAEYKEYTLPKQHNAVVTTTESLNPKAATLLRNASLAGENKSTFLTAAQFRTTQSSTGSAETAPRESHEETVLEEDKMLLASNSNSPTVASSNGSSNGLASNRTDSTSNSSTTPTNGKPVAAKTNKTQQQALTPHLARHNKNHLVASAESLSSQESPEHSPSARSKGQGPRKPATILISTSRGGAKTSTTSARSPLASPPGLESQHRAPGLNSPVSHFRTFKSGCSPGQRNTLRARTTDSNFRTLPVNGYANMLDQDQSSSSTAAASSLLIEAGPQEQTAVVAPVPTKSPKLLIRNNNLFQFKSSLHNYPGPQEPTATSEQPATTATTTSNVPDYFFKDEKEYRKFLAANSKQKLNCKQIISTAESPAKP